MADKSRTDKTICLAVSPSLKSYGLGGRARLYEVKQVVKDFNNKKLRNNKLKKFKRNSFFNDEVVLMSLNLNKCLRFFVKFSLVLRVF